MGGHSFRSTANNNSNIHVDTDATLVPTRVNAEETEEAAEPKIELGKLTRQELQELKRSDPFFFYSIPEMRQRWYNFEDSDTEDETEDEDDSIVVPKIDSDGTVVKTSTKPSSASATTEATNPMATQRGPARPATTAERRGNDEMVVQSRNARPYTRGAVTRKGRVSTEAHYILLMQNLFEDSSDESDTEEYDQIGARPNMGGRK